MGNSTGSMFYAFGAFLLIYLVGVSIYQIYHYINCNHLAWVGSERINQTF